MYFSKRVHLSFSHNTDLKTGFSAMLRGEMLSQEGQNIKIYSFRS